MVSETPSGQLRAHELFASRAFIRSFRSPKVSLMCVTMTLRACHEARTDWKMQGNKREDFIITSGAVCLEN